MFKVRISSGVKTALIILNEIFALLLIVVLMLTSSYGANSGSWDDLLRHRTYEQSDYFQTQSVNQATRAIRAAVRATRFEEEGVYAPERFVNIEEYAQKGIITGKYDKEGLYYRLGDLLSWAQSGWNYSVAQLDSQGTMWQMLEERYAPVNYQNLVVYATENGIDLNVVYGQVVKTLENIVSDVLSYRDNVNIFEPENSNVRYFLIDRGQKQVYTNVVGEREAAAEEMIAYVKAYDAYCVYDNQSLTVDSKNMELSVTELYGYAEKYGMSGSQNYVLAIGIDTDYPAQDVLYDGFERYESLQPIAWLAMIAGILGIVGYFLTISFLTAKAGVVAGEKELSLSWFDYWKTEVSFLVILTIAAIGIIPISVLNHYFSFLTREGIVSIVALAENLVFLAGWLSLIRRAKAKILWKNSFACQIAAIIQGTFENGKRTTKVIMLFGGYLLVNFALLTQGGGGFLVSLLFNLVVAGLLLREAIQDQKLLDGMKKLEEGELNYQYEVECFNGFRREFAQTLNGVNEVFLNSVMESMKNERMQTELITNVSHDIKTPLTSIINYVDLLKRENIENENAKGYIEILEQKSWRLKHLTEDLVEASKISSGNITLECIQIRMQEMICQAGGEFADKFQARQLTLIENLPEEPLYIRADGRRLWRVLENLFQNVSKYAMPNTRVYVDLLDCGSEVKFSIKNISEQRLNIDAKDLTERFIRGDLSRSTEGSGLGLSIAKNLTEMQGGKFSIYLDGDLFRVTIIFPKLEALPEELSMETLEENIEASLEETEK